MSQVQPGYLLNTLPCEFVAYLILSRRADHTQRARPNGESNLTLLPMTSNSLSFQVRHDASQYIHSFYASFFPAGITHWQHPNFFAYFPTASTFEGLLGDLYSSSVANPTFSVSSFIVRYLPMD